MRDDDPWSANKWYEAFLLGIGSLMIPGGLIVIGFALGFCHFASFDVIDERNHDFANENFKCCSSFFVMQERTLICT